MGIHGFGRGSTELGIPTANICPDTMSCSESFEDLPEGIYSGYARILNHANINSDVTFQTALSIGYNPQYNNKVKTVEPHLIAPSKDDPNRKTSKCGETLYPEFYG